MNRSVAHGHGGLGLALLGLVAVAAGQPAPTSQPTTVPAEQVPVLARVLEVVGDCQHAALGSEEWQACKLDERYPAETVIRTGIRSSVKLQIGDDDTYTALVIDAASRTVISEAFATKDTKRVRVGVGYGQIRAGVAEGGLKSDFIVDSPVATLSKRGTWDFGLFYERGTDRFQIFLLDRGLVEAFDKVRRERRDLQAGEYVTQVMRRWMDQAALIRNVPIPDVLGQGDLEVAFNRLRTNGLGVTDSEGGHRVLLDLSSASGADDFRNLVNQNLPLAENAAIVRPEGWFGTGRLDQLIPIIITANNPLAQKGLARPGKYVFRRSALEEWRAGRR